MENDKNVAFVIAHAETGAFFILDGRDIGEDERLAFATLFDDIDFAREMKEQQNTFEFEGWCREENVARAESGWRIDPYRWLPFAKQDLEATYGEDDVDPKDFFGPWVLKKVVLTTHFVD
jgi:hypothetical protein